MLNLQPNELKIIENDVWGKTYLEQIIRPYLSTEIIFAINVPLTTFRQECLEFSNQNWQQGKNDAHLLFQIQKYELNPLMCDLTKSQVAYNESYKKYLSLLVSGALFYLRGLVIYHLSPTDETMHLMRSFIYTYSNLIQALKVVELMKIY